MNTLEIKAIELGCPEALIMGVKYLERKLADYECDISYAVLRAIYEEMPC